MKMKSKFRLNLKDNAQKQESLDKAFKALERLDQSLSGKLKGGAVGEVYLQQWTGIHYAQIII